MMTTEERISGQVIFGGDIGGTDIKRGLSSLEGVALTDTTKTLKLPSLVREGPDRTIQQIKSGIDEFLDRNPDMKLGAIGVACAGNISLDGTVLASANFGTSWRGFHLRDELQKLFKSPITVDNDANAAALAEHRELGRRSQLLRTSPGFSLLIGTGLGTGMINDRGFLERGATGRAVELGHIPLALKWKTSVDLVRENVECGCGGVGCVEQYTALGFIQRELTAREPQNPAHPLYQIENRREAAKQVLTLAMAGDSFCISIIQHQAANLGMYVSYLIEMHDPAYVLIGGGITEADERLKAFYLQEVIDQVEHRLGVERRKEVLFDFTTLGDNAGWVGATISASESLISLAKESIAWPI